MKFYCVAAIDVTDPARVRDYAENVTPMVERWGGRYLARTANVVHLEGERMLPPVHLLIEWPSREIADAFYASEEYRPYRDARIAGSTGDIFLVAGDDDAGLATIR